MIVSRGVRRRRDHAGPVAILPHRVMSRKREKQAHGEHLRPILSWRNVSMHGRR
jgi:hypothetical protein